MYLDMEERKERFGRRRYKETGQIYNYKFSLYPDNHQPSVSVNMSRILTDRENSQSSNTINMNWKDNFSSEIIKQKFNSSVSFGNQTTTTISRSGDLCSNMYFQINPPSFNNILHKKKEYVFVDVIEIVEKEPIETFEKYLKNKIYNYIFNNYDRRWWSNNTISCLWSSGYLFITKFI